MSESPTEKRQPQNKLLFSDRYSKDKISVNIHTKIEKFKTQRKLNSLHK